MESGRRCDKCKFFDGPFEGMSDVDGQEAGLCRRFPPTMKGISAFPQVYGDGWCGEWTPCDASVQGVGAQRASPASVSQIEAQTKQVNRELGK